MNLVWNFLRNSRRKPWRRLGKKFWGISSDEFFEESLEKFLKLKSVEEFSKATEGNHLRFFVN